MKTPVVRTGLTRFLAGARPGLRGSRLGLIVHPASVTPELTPAADALRGVGCNVAALFGPQHGMRGDKQDDMIESDSFTDARLGIPVHSLYGDVRKPTPDMLQGLDALLFDLQDVGVRIYTFVWTMTLAMEACRDAGLEFVVLDRPNPINGATREGPILQQGFESFVGRYPIPLRHGLTAGEVARLVNDRFGIGCELDVVDCEGWSRSDWFDHTGLPFVLPSPNLPTLDSLIVYPGMVLLEGTNLSEGRGTTRPFELFGAPFIDPHVMTQRLDRLGLPGVVFRPTQFEPAFQKHSGQLCGGAQLHVTDRDVFRPVETVVAVLHAVKHLYPDVFAWRQPPYEYEAERMPIDLLWGSDVLRAAIDSGVPANDIVAQADPSLREFMQLVDPYLLY